MGQQAERWVPSQSWGNSKSQTDRQRSESPVPRSPQSHQEDSMKSSGGGHLSNIGVCFATTSSGPLASRVMPGSSAWLCGEILPGDRIISIGGSSARCACSPQGSPSAVV